MVEGREEKKKKRISIWLSRFEEAVRLSQNEVHSLDHVRFRINDSHKDWDSLFDSLLLFFLLTYSPSESQTTSRTSLWTAPTSSLHQICGSRSSTSCHSTRSNRLVRSTSSSMPLTKTSSIQSILESFQLPFGPIKSSHFFLITNSESFNVSTKLQDVSLWPSLYRKSCFVQTCLSPS